jgi:hypothetical protein
MKQTPSGHDLLVSLDSGTVDEFKRAEHNRFMRTTFVHNQLRIRDVANRLNVAASGIARGDRDMTGCQLVDEAQDQEWYASDVRRGIEYATRRDLRWLLGLPPIQAPKASLKPNYPKHCGKGYQAFEAWIERLVLPAKAQAQEPPRPVQSPAPQAPGQNGGDKAWIGTDRIPPVLMQQDGVQGPEQMVARTYEVVANNQTLLNYAQNVMRYRVEYHKKFAIPLASFCFVLLGMALALKYPRSGIGLVIGASMVIFLGFYILLIGGENLAKKGYLSPEVAIHGPLVLLTLLGLLAVRSANREMGTARTAGIFGALVEFFQRFRREAA